MARVQERSADDVPLRQGSGEGGIHTRYNPLPPPARAHGVPNDLRRDAMLQRLAASHEAILVSRDGDQFVW